MLHLMLYLVHCRSSCITLIRYILFPCTKVFVMAQRWGDEYFHFLAETLPRITLMLDVLRENLDIKVPDCAANQDG